MKLALYSNQTDFRSEMDVINALFKEGLDELHIRKQGWGDDEMDRYIGRINVEYHPKLVLHSCYTLVHKYDIDQIHIDEEWRTSFILRNYLKRIILKKKSVNKFTSFKSHKNLYLDNEDIDEAILGPVFSQTSITAASPVMKRDSLIRSLKRAKVPVMGIGGVTMGTIGAFKEMGFSGIVMQSSIWKALDPIEAYNQIKAISLLPVVPPVAETLEDETDEAQSMGN